MSCYTSFGHISALLPTEKDLLKNGGFLRGVRRFQKGPSGSAPVATGDAGEAWKADRGRSGAFGQKMTFRGFNQNYPISNV